MANSDDVGRLYGPSGRPLSSSAATRQAAETRERLDTFESRIVSRNSSKAAAQQDILKDILPKGATFARRQANLPTSLNLPASVDIGGRFSSNQIIQTQRPYQPEYESPDRLSYPVHRILANRYWRLFHKLDPTIGTGIDLYSEMMWSNFALNGEGIDGEPKRVWEDQINETQLLSVLPFFPREYFVTGEAIPHTIFDEEKGHWVHIALHNPDQLEVVDAPFLHMDPIIEFVPDDRLRQIVSSSEPSLVEVRESMPDELVARIQSGQNIPLDPMNCTFLPRKLHPYDVRGTSIISRLWRILMYEDGVFNASIATARRHACFVAGTQVLMLDGLKNIEDVRIGDEVIAGDGSIQQVEAAWQEPPSSTVTVEAVGTEPLNCTPNHNFLIWKTPRECACGCGEKIVSLRKGRRSAFVKSHHLKGLRDPKTGRNSGKTYNWRQYNDGGLKALESYAPIQKTPAGEIEQGDYLLIPRKFDEKHPGISREQARAFGYYAAEGSRYRLNSHDSICWSFGQHEEDTWVSDLLDCGSKMGLDLCKYKGTSPSAAVSGRSGAMRISITQVKDLWFAEWCTQNGGVGAKNKQLSEDVMRWPLYLKEEFIKGYYRGDGCLNHYKHANCSQVSANSVSRTLIYQVRLILAQIGVFGSISVDTKDKIKNPEWNDSWTISSTGADARKLAKLIVDEHIESPWGAENRKGMSTWLDDKYVYVLVQKVTKNNAKVPVYNLSVSGDHSYIANGVQTFNSPIKIIKLGNERTGWIPGPVAEAKMADLIAKAELDPHSWIVTHYGVAFEAWGTTDRTMSISREQDVIERIKLIGMGLSKAFVVGEITYSAAEKGLQTFLQRLKTLRNYFESAWIIPKFFRQTAEINGWEKISKSEQRHNYRIKRSARERQWITPTIEWENSLSPRVDEEMLRAVEGLARLNIKISKKTGMGTTAGLSFEKELRQIKEEERLEKEILAEPDTKVTNTGEGSDVPLPLPPQSKDKEVVDGVPAAAEVPVPKPPEGTEEAASEENPTLPVPTPPWTEDEHIRPVASFLSEDDPTDLIDSDFWRPCHAAFLKQAGHKSADIDERWNHIEAWLEDEGFLDGEINNLHLAMVAREILKDPVKQAFLALPEDASRLSDKDFGALLDNPAIQMAAVKKKSEKVEDDFFLVGCAPPVKGAQWSLGKKAAQAPRLNKYTKLIRMKGHGPGCGANCSHTKTAQFTGSDGRFERGEFLDAIESRNEWQKRLDTSKYPEAVKNRVKFLENRLCDDWSGGFEALWALLDRRLQTRLPLDPQALRELMSHGLTDQCSKLECQEYYDSLADIYAEGKLYSYKPLKFDEKKRLKLKEGRTASLNKIAITIDSVDERKVLDQIADNALDKVRNTVTESMKARILDALSAPGAAERSVMDLANELVRGERDNIEQTSRSKDELKARLRDLYDTQLFNIQRIMRTEAINAYATATLRGYKEQGIAKVKWNSHHDMKTCNLCLSLDGIEFEVDYLLTLGAYPISSISHPQCFTGRQKIATDEGLETFEELFKSQRVPKVLVDYRVRNKTNGTVVFDPHSKTRNGKREYWSRLEQATAVYDTGVQEVLKLTLDTGHELEVSLGHEMWVEAGNARWEKKEACKLAIGDKVPLITRGESFGKDHFPLEAELMGNALGDGVFNKNTETVEWHFFGNDIPYGEKLFEDLKQKYPHPNFLGSLNIEPANNKYKTSHAIFRSGRLGAIFKEEFGFTKKPRRVPARLFTADKETVSAFLRGLFAADGHPEFDEKASTRVACLAQNDLTFLKEIQLLLSMFGFVSRIYSHGKATEKIITYANGDEHLTKRKACFRLHLGGVSQFNRFLIEIGWGVPDKQIRVSSGTESKIRNYWRTAKIEKIENLGEQQTYCLTEPKVNTVTVNGIVTGQCRCFVTPVITFVSFDEFEQQYQKTNPTTFEPTQTVVDGDKISDLTEVLQDLHTKLLEFKGIPVEYVEPVQNAATVIEVSDFAKYMPKTVRMVPDVAGTPEFQDIAGKESSEALAGQVTHFTTEKGEALISGFAARDTAPSATVIRAWADGIWRGDAKTQTIFTQMFEKAKRAQTPQSISPEAARRLTEIFAPVAVGRRVQVGPIEAVGLNKKFREMDEEAARAILAEAKISRQDAEAIIGWRKEYGVMWDLASGGIIESDRPPTANNFVSEVAAVDPEHYFTESMVAYYTMPIQLQNRDPDCYELLKSQYFSKQEFADTKPGDT